MNQTNRHSFDIVSYEVALQRNRELQDEIRKQLKHISTKKARNRQSAAQVVSEVVPLTAAWVGRAEKAPCCSWERSFFQGPSGGTIPDANEDLKERINAADSTFFKSTDPPWSNSELRLLSVAIQRVEQEKGEPQRDYEIAAKYLAEPKQKKTKAAASSGIPRRSAKQCELAHKELSKISFEKKERDELAKLIQMNGTNGGGFLNEDGTADWQSVADALGTKRSAWECFCEYQRFIAKRKSQPWTLLQDELLFKYVATMGPQLVIDGNEIMHLRSGVFMDKSKRQLFDRINLSLLNPNLKHDGWSDEEERRLALCMKVYSDQPARALFLAGTHIYGRSVASVAKKWSRSLDPEYSARPFTKQDDEALLRAMRQHPTLGWVDIARRFFPDRHPHRLMNRWSEIATDEDIISRHGESLVQRVSVLSPAASERAVNDNNSNNASCLRANDLVVRVRKRKR